MNLSDRQQEILALLALGKSNKEIAYELKITEGTVKQHLFTLYKKLNTTNRAKTVIAATKFLEEKNQSSESVSPSSILTIKSPNSYVWRLITAVAIYPKNHLNNTALGRARHHQEMNLLQNECQALADALDGLLTVVPGVGLVACFGLPKSHLDDPARGIFFANRIQLWLAGNTQLEASIGVATAAEVVADNAKTIYRAESFEMAAQLAVEAPSLKVWANEVTCRLAGPVIKYSGPRNDDEKKISYRELLLDEKVDSKSLASKTPLPFLPEITQNLKDKKAMWVSVDGWPPHASVRLQDAISIALQAQGIATYQLRLPTDSSIEEIGHSAYTQLNILARIRQRQEGNEIFLKSADSNAQKLLASLKILTLRGHLAVIFYGINSHESLIKVLGEKGLDELMSYPVIFITSTLNNDDQSHVGARILGNRPNLDAKHKLYKLPLAKPPVTPQGISADLATLIDNLSQNARAIVRYIALRTPIKVMELGHFVGEVLSTGLFKLEDDVIQCRDEETLKALRSLYVEDTEH